jgi:SAM-dependent methyltransferase
MSSVAHTIRLFQAFREEPTSPDTLYRMLAADAVQHLARYMDLTGRVAVDVGGGPGYVGEALRNAGARCLTLDIDVKELTLHGRSAVDAAVADALHLPLSDNSMDIAHSSNVLEHVREPWDLLSELARVVRPGGLIFLSFTNWYSPWGGHETSPWHYLGGERAVRRYTRRHGSPPGSLLGRNLFPIHISQVLRWVRERPDLTVVEALPRYYPGWFRPIVALPIVREFLTWNLELILRKGEF